jgi:hypothetical protein
MADKEVKLRKRSFDEREPSGQHKHLNDTVKSSAEAAAGDSIMFGGIKTRKNARVREDIKDGAEGILRIKRRIEEVHAEINRLRRVLVQLLKALACHDLDKQQPTGFQPSKEAVIEGRAKIKAAKDAEAEILNVEPEDSDLDDSAAVNVLVDEPEDKPEDEPEDKE